MARTSRSAATSTPPAPHTAIEPLESYPGEQAEWDDYVESIIDAIQRGMFDQNLKPIARSIFDRRDVLNGNAPGTSFKGGKATKGEGTASAPSKATGAANALIGTIPKVTGSTDEPCFTYNGYSYKRSDIMHKVVELPYTVSPQYCRGLKVEITGIGPKKIKAKFIDLPPAGTRFGDAATRNEDVFLPLAVIAGFLA